MLFLALVALGDGGTFSPVAFAAAGLALVFWPVVQRNSLTRGVVPLSESILLRSRLFPFRWHALAEVKLESQDQARGVAAIDGRLLLFAGRAPAAFVVVSVYAIGRREAEERVIRALRKETVMMSQRGAHLLPLDSTDASLRLSLRLERLRVGTDDFRDVTSLPFDLFALEAKEGLIARHRAFRIGEPGGPASIPPADLSFVRLPLFAEVVEEIAEKHGWPAPDEFSSFLAALDASRTEPLSDRLRTRSQERGMVVAETPGGAEAKLTRAQLRAVARIYA